MRKLRQQLLKKKALPQRLLKRKFRRGSATKPADRGMLRTLSPPESGPSPPRILMVVDQFNIGGTETYTLSMTRELVRQGAHVAVCGKKGKLLDAFVGIGCPYYEIDFRQQPPEKGSILHAEHLQLLTAVIRAERIEVVHAHQHPSGSLAQEAALLMNVPFVFTVHGKYYHGEFLDQLKDCDALISVSPSVARMLSMREINSQVIANGIDVQEYQPYDPVYREHLRSSLGIPRDAQVILYASRLTWEKADICEELIRAIALLRSRGNANLHLLIAGSGLNIDKVIQLARREQLNHQPFISLAGESVKMRSYYAVSDCVIGTGRVALEAMACMKPLISIGSRGFFGTVQPDNYDEAWNTWFGDHDAHEPWTQDNIIRHIESIQSMGPELKAELVRRNREFVMDRFNIVEPASRLMDLYRQVFSRKRASMISG